MKAVIDTNVLLIANQKHSEASPDCVEICIKRLCEMQRFGVVVVDDKYRILQEYRKKTRPNQPKGIGDVFLKWLFQHMGTCRIEQVALTDIAEDWFREFPDASLQADFDASDRKFVAVAYVHPDRPPVWQASDSKWLRWHTGLEAAGIQVEFLCPDDVGRFYDRKFPGSLALD